MTLVTLNDMPVEHKTTFFQMFSTARCNNANREQAKSHTREAFTKAFVKRKPLDLSMGMNFYNY
jgi:hypothetical protein